jgi:hypothetical protein
MNATSTTPTLTERAQTRLSTSVAQKVTNRVDIAGVGDCLFGPEFSQSWRFVGR